MSKAPDKIRLELGTTGKTLSMSIFSNGTMTTALGKQSLGGAAVDKLRTRMIFSLADIVLAGGYKAKYAADSVLKEANAIEIVRKKKKKRIRFVNDPAVAAMPSYLRLLVLEMSGLSNW